MLGDEIRKARKAAGLTQEELAFRARIARNCVSLLERGAKSPAVDTLMRVCRALGVRASTLAMVDARSSGGGGRSAKR